MGTKDLLCAEKRAGAIRLRGGRGTWDSGARVNAHGPSWSLAQGQSGAGRVTKYARGARGELELELIQAHMGTRGGAHEPQVEPEARVAVGSFQRPSEEVQGAGHLPY